MPANRQSTGKRGGKRSTSWKPGQSGNPTGRPRDGESWAGIIREISELDVDSVLQVIDAKSDLGKKISKHPRGVQLKHLVIIRAFIALIEEPTAGLLNTLIDRVEGKVKDQIEMTGNVLTDGERWDRIVQIMDKIYGRKTEAEAMEEAEAPNPDELGPVIDQVYKRQETDEQPGPDELGSSLDRVYGKRSPRADNNKKPP